MTQRTPAAIRKELARLMERGAREVEDEKQKAAFTAAYKKRKRTE